MVSLFYRYGKILGIFTDALFKAGIDFFFVAPSPQHKSFAALVAANGYFHSRIIHTCPPLP
jgi:hypothetical protein